jgi:hypothetical protein
MAFGPNWQESHPNLALVPDADHANGFTQGTIDELQAAWQDRPVQQTLARFEKQPPAPPFNLQIKDLMRRIDVIGRADYVPTPSDIAALSPSLRVHMCEIEHNQFALVEVVKQIGVQKKWISLMDNAVCVIFVASLADYDVMEEDGQTNRLRETLNEFEILCNCRAFKSTAFMLILVKSDVLERKLRRTSLQVCFPEYNSADELRDALLPYITNQFLQRSHNGSRRIFTHACCALEENLADFIFRSTREVVIEDSLKDAEVM